jgi:hypothetical protein
MCEEKESQLQVLQLCGVIVGTANGVVDFANTSTATWMAAVWTGKDGEQWSARPMVMEDPKTQGKNFQSKKWSSCLFFFFFFFILI